MLGSAFDLGRSIGDFNESVRTSGGFRGAFYADQYGDCAATSKIFDFAQRHGRQSPDVRPGAGKWMVIERNTERFALNCPIGRALCRERVCTYVWISGVALQ